NIIQLIMSLAIILISCELFTNGVEWLGKKLKVGDGVVGSIFSAVGTCLPETMVPVIAILFFGNNKDSIDIGVGAIIGAPFMLSTLAFFVTGISVLVFWQKRKTGLNMNVNSNILCRDISFFIITYSIGLSSAIISIQYIRNLIAVFLIAAYIFYIFLTVSQDKTNHVNIDNLYFSSIFNAEPSIYNVLFQVSTALLGIILGAHIFVKNIEKTSEVIGISALILSLVVTPIATELPEKFNSIIWISKKKDTLALGNITGAMVFQSCIPVSIGIIATPWHLGRNLLVCAILSVLSASTTYFWLENRKKLSPAPLIMGGVFYLIFIISLKH
ncbi:MAG: sodium:calcium antiporter, partial [Clostridiaceae bacterium]|nr:sodium:calcium antiporter [Clostridiaceae bacterium]